MKNNQFLKLITLLIVLFLIKVTNKAKFHAPRHCNW